MHPVTATLSTLILFLAPGLVLVAALNARKKTLELTFGEQIYLVLAGSLVLSGWAGLLVAELGHFSAVRVATAVGGLTLFLLVGALLTRKHLSLRPGALRRDELAVLVCLIGFGVAVYFPPYEYILGGRDPGVYVNTGFHLAREGNLTYVDPVVLSVPEEERDLFFRVDKDLPPWSQPRFLGFHMDSPDSGHISPQGLHLYPVWIGIASQLFEMKAGLYATPFFALMGVAGFFFALRRLFNTEVALWASGMMAVFQIQIWFARFPNAEILVQFLYVTGLLTFYFMDEKRSSVAGLLSGAAFGATLLVRMENLLFLLPLGLYLGWRRLRRDLGTPELAFLGAFSLIALHAAFHGRFFAWPYVSNVLGRHYWRIFFENIAVFASSSAVVFLLIDRLGTKVVPRIAPLIESKKARIAAAMSIFVLALYAYFIRPIWHGLRTAPHDAEAFLRMGWYLYPVGLALVVAGAMFLLARSERRQALFVLVGLTFSLFFFYKVRVWHDHYFAMRRFLPVILPSLLACVAVFLVTLRRSGGRLTHWGAPLLGGLLLLIYVNDGRRLWSHEEFRGSLGFVEELSRHIGDEDVVIFPRQEGLHLLELPLAELHGKNVLEFYTLKPPRELIEDLVRQWSGRYGDIYFVTNYKISLSGLFTRQVKDFWLATEKYEYAYTRPPKGPEPFHLRFTLSKAVDLEDLQTRVPPLPFLDVGNSDDLQVAWFHEKELEEDGTSYRWSQQISSIFLPEVAGKTQKVALRLAGPKENGTPLNPVEVAIDDHTIGTIAPSRNFEVFELNLPERGENEYSILTLSTETWRPSNALADASDVRDLGARIDWVELR